MVWYGSRFTAAENLNFGVPIFFRLGVHLNKVSLLEDEVVKIPGESVHQVPETLIGAIAAAGRSKGSAPW